MIHDVVPSIKLDISAVQIAGRPSKNRLLQFRQQRRIHTQRLSLQQPLNLRQPQHEREQREDTRRLAGRAGRRGDLPDPGLVARRRGRPAEALRGDRRDPRPARPRLVRRDVDDAPDRGREVARTAPDVEQLASTPGPDRRQQRPDRPRIDAPLLRRRLRRPDLA